ncbi:hypothetical protein B1B04_24870 [Lysinibacillus sp. KCTC 33748]|uniref:discoidin domain-containing protein n=1 Tax=unclassified Lysinibacillus TaxID=2636778 RepID=UPI0009A6CBC3|nr:MULTISPECIES: discoidin domain-containing protein [unclassified Lysinibacillus]OXS65743.1 hypothetical protein B1B04_24870 [Lysinibacillus sp. KCTC 33748]SKC19397.1 F5/8 type C domain-containing protein [Lysinibacillus sp. AC-3]
MTRVNVPSNYKGEEISFDYLNPKAVVSNGTSSYTPTALFNDIITKEGTYGAVLLRYTTDYLEFFIPDDYINVEIWFSSGAYSDSAGGTGNATTLKKYNDILGVFENINSNIQTTSTSVWYKYYDNLDTGRYRISPNRAYVQFNEIFVSGRKRDYCLLQSPDKTTDKIYSLESNNASLYETKMASNTTPSPLVASASSVWSSSYEAWRVFNGTNNNSGDCWASANYKSGWIQIDFGAMYSFNRMRLSARNDLGSITASPKHFQILASKDGVTYSILFETKNEINWAVKETREYTFKSTKKYRYYKLNIIDNNGFSYIAIGKIEFFNTGGVLTEIPSNSSDNFLKYGQSSLGSFSNQIHSKNYILQNVVSKNEEGLWTARIDRKPLSINFE